MAIVTRQARKADFETQLKPTIKASAYISVNAPLAISVYNGSVFEFDEGGAPEIRPFGIPSAEVFGYPSAVYDQPVVAVGIGSEEAFGTPVINLFIQPSGIASEEACGSAAITLFIQPAGIASEEAFGLPALQYDQFITPLAILSGERFGASLFKYNRVERRPAAPGIRFGMKKIADGGAMSFGLKSKLGLKKKATAPVVAPPGIIVCTFYPGSLTVTDSPLDGHTDRYSLAGSSFSYLRTATADCYPQVDETFFEIRAYAGTIESPFWTSLTRSFILFDTSALGADVEIISAEFSARKISETNDDNITDDDMALCMVGSNPASPDSLICADHGTIGAVLYASKKTHPYVESDSRISFDLNADGLAAINKTGLTKFGLIANCDYMDQSPVWAANSGFQVDFYSRNSSYRDNWPRLVITARGNFACPENGEGSGGGVE